MDFINLLKEKLIVFLEADQKADAIKELAAYAGAHGYVRDADDLFEKLMYREQLMSTGLGLGIGVPHVRYADLKEPVVLMGIQPAGVQAYDSIDNQSVTIVVMILVGEGQHKLHVKLLSQIVSKLKDPDLRQKVLSADSADVVSAIIREQ